MVAIIKPDEQEVWEGAAGRDARESFSLVNLLAQRESLARDFTCAADSGRIQGDGEDDLPASRPSTTKWRFFRGWGASS